MTIFFLMQSMREFEIFCDLFIHRRDRVAADDDWREAYLWGSRVDQQAGGVLRHFGNREMYAAQCRADEGRALAAVITDQRDVLRHPQTVFVDRQQRTDGHLFVAAIDSRGRGFHF